MSMFVCEQGDNCEAKRPNDPECDGLRNRKLVRRNRQLSTGVFSVSYSQRSVATAWTNPSPWSILAIASILCYLVLYLFLLKFCLVVFTFINL